MSEAEDDARLMIEDCEARESKMTDWERKFIDSVSSQDRPLSDRQLAKLEEIWSRLTD